VGSRFKVKHLNTNPSTKGEPIIMIEPRIFKTEPDYENDTYTVQQTCTGGCGVTYTTTVLGPDLFRWRQGYKVQEAFPAMPASERELYFQTGICGECWDELFAEEEN
jgi:hypothetical protein